MFDFYKFSCNSTVTVKISAFVIAIIPTLNLAKREYIKFLKSDFSSIHQHLIEFIVPLYQFASPSPNPQAEFHFIS